MDDDRRVPLGTDLDIVAARVEGRNLAREMGFGIIDQARIATAVSELARNAIAYAQGGEISFQKVEPNGKVGLQIVCRDQGPGIRDVQRIIEQEVEWSPELGMGLAGTRRLMDEFSIQSEVGVGTTVVVCKWLR